MDINFEDRAKNLERTIQNERTRKEPGSRDNMETTWQQKLDSMYDDLRCIWGLMQKLKKANLVPDRFMADLSDMDTEKEDTPLQIPNTSYYKMNRIFYKIRYEKMVYTLRLRSGKKIGNIVEVYASSPDTDKAYDPKEEYRIYNRIHGETKQFIHDFYAWFDKRFPPEDNGDETLDTYFVTYRIEGRYTAEIKARSPEDAINESVPAYENADFGELHDIGECGNTYAVSVADKTGNIVWEK